MIVKSLLDEEADAPDIADRLKTDWRHSLGNTLINFE
jgi:hypothetical protein